jgi:hypothetical protein
MVGAAEAEAANPLTRIDQLRYITISSIHTRISTDTDITITITISSSTIIIIAPGLV